MTAANEAVTTSGSTTAVVPASNEPAAISATPAPARTSATQVRESTGSDRSTQPSSAAIIGAAACMKRTFATVV
jgi:hypothetical protein